MKKITILTSPNLTKHYEGDVAFLFEYASDSDIALLYPRAINLPEILNADLHNKQKLSSDIAKLLLCNEPYIRDVPQLTVFIESVCKELYKATQLIDVCNFLSSNGYDVCEFISHSWWGNGINHLVKIAPFSFKVLLPKAIKSNPFTRVIQRIYRSKFNVKSLFIEMHNLINYLDPFGKRFILFRLGNRHKVYKQNQYWFYSTAINYTNIGLAYEPYFPKKFKFIVSDKSVGGSPLLGIKRTFYHLSEFSELSFIPSKNEVKVAKEAILKTLLTEKLNNYEELVKRVFLESTWLHVFFTRLLPIGLFSSAIFAKFIFKTKPLCLVVGNQAHEGYALYHARKNKVPTILLQHGVIDEYYKYIDYALDHYIVRGKFFLKRLSLASQPRTSIINIPKKIHTQKAKGYFVFITMPHYLLPIEVDLSAILKSILLQMNALQTKLVIRVHPLEKIYNYTNMINDIILAHSLKVTIEYSQGTSLEELLSGAYACIQFHSTVFLSCIMQRTTIISFDWCYFEFKQNLKHHEIFNYAQNLKHMNYLIKLAYQQKLEIKNHDEIILKLDNKKNVSEQIRNLTHKLFLEKN